MYFCLTKATRSLLASNILANLRYREDAMILCRSAYETYLLIQSMHLEYDKYKEYLYNQIDKNEITELEYILNKLKKYLIIILDELDFSMRNSNLKDMILKRINEIII